MATTQNTYTGNGSTTNYSFTFPYLEETDIKVSLNGVDTAAYTFANATTISFTTAPANGVAIRIYRDTDVDNLQSTFFAGSAIRAQDLNDNFLQSNYTVQEIKSRYLDNSGGTMSGVLNMGNNKIINLATPTAASDSSTKGYVDGLITTHQAQVDAAAASASAAASSQSAAATSATNSANSATASANSATASATSATNSANSATNSANSATASAASASAASTSATAAAGSASAASTSASNALTSANNAANSASNASTSASNASASATAAANSATSAATSAASALAAFDSFDDRYLGAKASDPTLDNDGDPLNAGDLYYNTTNSVMRVFTGTVWVTAFVPGDAANISFTSGGSISSNNVQGAIEEVRDEKVTRTSTTGAAEIPAGNNTTERPGSPAAGYLRFNTTDTTFEGWDGSAWGPIGGGASAGGAIYETSNTISANYNLTAGTNGLSAGPITIASGVVVTIPSGSRWVIV